MKHIVSILVVIALVFGGFLLFNNDSEEINESNDISESPIKDTSSENLIDDESIEYGDITAKEAKKLIKEDSNIILLDVRTKGEYDERHIPDATLIPLQELESRIDELDKDKTYLIYCRSGNRSRQAFKLLQDKGFEKLYNLEGGIKAFYN